jgi:uncharacterized membrane protein YsdA (DUF1294 family)
MAYALCLMILPFLIFILYEVWKETAESRDRKTNERRV